MALDGNDVSLFTAANPRITLGDANQDGVVDLFDIAAFIDVLTSGIYVEEADLDFNSSVDLFDIAPLVGILTGN